MIYQDPVTDRTAADITNRTAKAFLNIVDWVRIYDNAHVMQVVVDFVLGITTTFNAVGTPTITTFPTAADINTLIANILRVLNVSGITATFTGFPDLIEVWGEGTAVASPDYTDVNDWELAISLILSAVTRAADYRVYTGVAGTGQPRHWQVRFRTFSGWIQPSVSPVRRARTNVAIAGEDLTSLNGFRRND